jgi:primosomal protein N'
MTRRVHGHDADVELVDMRDEAAEGNTKPLSRRLVEVVTRTLENEEQTILYLNRRGLATYVMCRDCGRSVQCLGCSVALVQHAEIGGLVCHYCGYARAMPSVCDFCGSRNIRGLGMGTQRLEGMVKKYWPQARVLRLDSDVARGPDSYFRVWETFSERRADILVGTQLVTRGLDLPAVTCVGVVDADLPLHFPDYRSAETTFSLVAQVAGRAWYMAFTALADNQFRLGRRAAFDTPLYAASCLPERRSCSRLADLAALRTDREDAKAAASAREAAEAIATAAATASTESAP